MLPMKNAFAASVLANADVLNPHSQLSFNVSNAAHRGSNRTIALNKSC